MNRFKKSLEIPQEQSAAVNWRRTHNTVIKTTMEKKASNGWCWCIFNKDGLDNHRATGVASSDYHWKTYGEFDREGMLWLWCSTLLKRSITCSVAVVKHIIHYNPRSSFSNYSQVTPHREVIPSPPHGDVQFCGTRPGKRHQWPTTFILS
jgi:hypothetical protein